jgi:hypothetical protein
MRPNDFGVLLQAQLADPERKPPGVCSRPTMPTLQYQRLVWKHLLAGASAGIADGGSHAEFLVANLHDHLNLHGLAAG